MYSDNKKKEYMRMFFDEQPSLFCENELNFLKLKDENRRLLKYRYVHHQTDKMIAISYQKELNIKISPDRINKKINMALVEAYNALKHAEYNAFKATN